MLPENGRDMRDILALLDSLGAYARPAGPDTVRLTGVATAGRAVFQKQCARCHGVSGTGLKKLAPAVWGIGSYSIGAGLARQSVLATFVQENMPYDKAVRLTAQQSADVAAFVLSKPRQDHPGKADDWPKGDAPADVAYATTGARTTGKLLPPPRIVLPRRIAPTTPSTRRSR